MRTVLKNMLINQAGGVQYADAVIAQIEASTSSTTTTAEKQAITEMYNLYNANGGEADYLYIADLSTPLSARNANSATVASITTTAFTATMQNGDSSNMISSSNYSMNTANNRHIRTNANKTITCTNFTYMVWARKTGATQQSLFNINALNPRVAITGATNDYQLYWSGAFRQSSPNAFANNTSYYHLALIGNSTDYILYINGVAVNTTPHTATNLVTSGFPHSLGGVGSAAVNWNDGMNHMYYKQAVLTPTQISNIFNGTKSAYGY